MAHVQLVLFVLKDLVFHVNVHQERLITEFDQVQLQAVSNARLVTFVRVKEIRNPTGLAYQAIFVWQDPGPELL